MKKATSPFLNLRMVPQCLFCLCFLEQLVPNVTCSEVLESGSTGAERTPGKSKTWNV